MIDIVSEVKELAPIRTAELNFLVVDLVYKRPTKN